MRWAITQAVSSIMQRQLVTLQHHHRHQMEMLIAIPTLCLSMKPSWELISRAGHLKPFHP